jgi:elongation of very long chain fatty acids protein 6
MNYSVHASMYGYYFLTAMRLKPKWFNPMIITAFQISQMVVGVAVTCVAFYFYQTEKHITNSIGEPGCQLKAENNTAAFVMYGSYLFLFLQFFIGRYGVQPKKVATFTTKQKQKAV